jgi:hypothetical protein
LAALRRAPSVNLDESFVAGGAQQYRRAHVISCSTQLPISSTMPTIEIVAQMKTPADSNVQARRAEKNDKTVGLGGSDNTACRSDYGRGIIIDVSTWSLRLHKKCDIRSCSSSSRMAF